MANSASVAVVDNEVPLVRAYEVLFGKRRIPMAFSAYTGIEAVEKFKSSGSRPKVVIIDYRLPDMTGLEVMWRILEVEPETRIVLISGDEGVRRESLEAGAEAFIKKPASIREIVDTVLSLVSS
jgi:FixJ family two-component response regulator